MRVRVRRQKSAAVENGGKKKIEKIVFSTCTRISAILTTRFQFFTIVFGMESNCLRASFAMTTEKWCWTFLFIHFPNVHFIVDCHSEFTSFEKSSSTWNQSNNFCSSTTTTSDELAHQCFSFVLSIITSQAHNTKSSQSSECFVCVITKGNSFFSNFATFFYITSRQSSPIRWITLMLEI